MSFRVRQRTITSAVALIYLQGVAHAVVFPPCGPMAVEDQAASVPILG